MKILQSQLSQGEDEERETHKQCNRLVIVSAQFTHYLKDCKIEKRKQKVGVGEKKEKGWSGRKERKRLEWE